MSLQYSLTQSQSLKLNMTPRLMQSIHMLQFSSDELSEFIIEQSVENPLLDITWPTFTSDKKRGSQSTSFSTGDWDRLANITSSETLEMMLLSQLRLSGISKRLFTITKYLAGNLNDDGYLVVPLEEACRACRANMDEVQAALECLHALEPAGVGARNLKECLQIQIRKDSLAEPQAYELVSEYLNELGKGKFKWIADKMQISLEEVRRIVEYIRGLNPRPGLPYRNLQKTFIQPDAVIRKIEGEYVVVMNDSHIPKLALNKEYHHLFVNAEYSEEQSYLRNHFQNAKWLIHSLKQRKMTLYRVIQSIVEEQNPFFEGGVLYLKPMNLKVIADRLDLHISTVSRATQHKYIQTPHGTFELKFFFSAGLSTLQGVDSSAESIKAKIKNLIDNEDKRNPLSDQKITSLLVNEGIQISRRTVMKYREELNILSSRMRCSG